MRVLIGTEDGLYGVENLPFDDPELLLECGHTNSIKSFSEIDGIFVASKTGLYWSNEGETWTQVELPPDIEQVWELIHLDGTIFIGTYPGAIYASSDEGETWRELEGLQTVPNRDRWRNPLGPDGRVRALATPPNRPEVLLAGVEAGGFFVSNDRGETWVEKDVCGQHDFHQIVTIGPEEYLIACGRLSVTDLNHGANTGGVYHTTDGGENFTSLNANVDPDYFREILYHEGTLCACGSLTIPPVWLGGLGAEAHLFESTDLKEFTEKSFPGGPDEIVIAWDVHEGSAIGGTTGGDSFTPGPPKGGRIIRRTSDGEWSDCGTVPSNIHSLLSV